MSEGRWRGEGRGGSLGYTGKARWSDELVTVMVIQPFSQREGENNERDREFEREREMVLERDVMGEGHMGQKEHSKK